MIIQQSTAYCTGCGSCGKSMDARGWQCPRCERIASICSLWWVAGCRVQSVCGVKFYQGNILKKLLTMYCAKFDFARSVSSCPVPRLLWPWNKNHGLISTIIKYVSGVHCQLMCMSSFTHYMYVLHVTCSQVTSASASQLRHTDVDCLMAKNLNSHKHCYMGLLVSFIPVMWYVLQVLIPTPALCYVYTPT